MTMSAIAIVRRRRLVPRVHVIVNLIPGVRVAIRWRYVCYTPTTPTLSSFMYWCIDIRDIQIWSSAWVSYLLTEPFGWDLSGASNMQELQLYMEEQMMIRYDTLVHSLSCVMILACSVRMCFHCLVKAPCMATTTIYRVPRLSILTGISEKCESALVADWIRWEYS